MGSEMIGQKAIGLDVGSTAAKMVKLEGGRLVERRSAATLGWKELLPSPEEDGIPIFSTGYFRKNVPHVKAVTEITAAAYGAQHYFPEAEVIADIGGQDVKVTDLRSNTFLLNDKCSAGTGAFLEMVANYFKRDVGELGTLHFKSGDRAEINHTCGVFALSEMITHLVKGKSIEDCIAGMHFAFARRISDLIPSDAGNIVLIGGTARNEGIVDALSRVLGKELLVPDEPQFVCALGAVLYGREECEK